MFQELHAKCTSRPAESSQPRALELLPPTLRARLGIDAFPAWHLVYLLLGAVSTYQAPQPGQARR
jgi:hypothetical protein